MVRLIQGFVVATVCIAATSAFAQEHTRDTLPTVQDGLKEQKAVLVDVREKEEWDDGHLRDARLLPLSVLERGGDAETTKSLPKDKVIYLHCAAGARCLKAAAILKKQGYDARALKPGYQALLKAGFAAASP